MKRIFLLCFLILSFSRFAEAIAIFHDFKIEPNSLFMEEERGVLFTVQLEARLGFKPRSAFLLEMDSTGERVRYRWELKDDGVGDFKASDGIYSRIIQFKEKKPRTIHFLVLSQVDPENIRRHLIGKNELHSALKETLEIKPRPTFIEILSEVWKKIKRKVLQ